MQSISSTSEPQEPKIGFPAKISLVSLAKEFGTIDETFKVENNECVVIDKENLRIQQAYSISLLTN